MGWSIDYRGPRHPDESEIYQVTYSAGASDKFYFRGGEDGCFELFNVDRSLEPHFHRSEYEVAEKLLREKNLDKIVDEDGDVLIEVVRGDAE